MQEGKLVGDGEPGVVDFARDLHAHEDQPRTRVVRAINPGLLLERWLLPARADPINLRIIHIIIKFVIELVVARVLLTPSLEGRRNITRILTSRELACTGIGPVSYTHL